MKGPGRRALLACLLPALLAACATAGVDTAPDGASISGRLSVRVEASGNSAARSVSAGFDLQGTPASGRLNLSNPLGTVLAQARWSPRDARLTTSEGEKRFPDLDSLTQEMLGERLPVAALFDWLRGRPWLEAPSEATTPPAPAGFRQLGWTVDTSRIADGWLVAQRSQAPAVTVKARVEP